MLNVAFSELKMKKGKVVLTNRGSIVEAMGLANKPTTPGSKNMAD